MIYIFKDFAGIKAYSNYPMLVKLSSARQTKWTCELLNDLIAKQGYILNELPAPIETTVELDDSISETSVAIDIFSKLKGKNYRRSFEQRLRRSSKEVKNWYFEIVNFIKAYDRVRVIESDYFRTFKIGNKPIAKITIKGKTINLYLALKPSDYINTKYIFEDSSSIKKYANYPMRIKLTSNRKVKWSIELLSTLLKEVAA